jgi:uroporphyrinogen-III synthase
MSRTYIDEGDDRRPGGGAGPVAGRGILVVAILAAIGVLLLWQALDGPSGTTAAPPGETTSTTADPAGTTSVVETTTTTAAAPVPLDPAGVKVVVANAAGINGAAGAMTDILKGRNYTTLDPTTATVKNQAVTAVYFTNPDSASAAAQVAADIGAEATLVALVPADVPVQASAFAEAMVLVVLGQDLAA